MSVKSPEISHLLAERIKSLKLGKPEFKESGQVISVRDGIVRAHGLDQAFYEECVEIHTQKGEVIKGLILNLEADSVSIVTLGDYTNIIEGDLVTRTKEKLKIPVGPELLGRVVNALGEPIDDLGPIKTKESAFIEQNTPGIMDRKSVHEPVKTGITMIDSMIPIGRGQRELIIGDRQTGKTTIALDTIISQRHYNNKQQSLYCIYVAIGQKRSTLARIVQTLKDHNALEYTIIVSATASDLNILQFLAPYVATSIGEYFRDHNQHALIIYDDLSKHAVSYRQMALLMRRAPGREAYPGDIFYVHSRLLERSAQLSEEKGGGSLTALPIIETQAGDVSAYIPTNVISITDGQIFLQTNLFHQGIKPAINLGISVSRVGSAAQTTSMKKIASQLKLDLAQYHEIKSFSQFTQNMDESTKKFLTRGQKAEEIIKQDSYDPIPYNISIWLIFLVTKGFLDDIPLDKIKLFKERAIKYFQQHKFDLDNWQGETSIKKLTVHAEKLKAAFK